MNKIGLKNKVKVSKKGNSKSCQFLLKFMAINCKIPRTYF